MKNILGFTILLFCVYSCSNRIIKSKVQDKNTIQIIESTAIDSFVNNVIHYERKKVDVFSEEDRSHGVDQDAYFYQTDNFDVLQIGRFGSIQKQEVYYFLKNEQIVHISDIDFQYNQPYYERDGFEMTSTKKDYEVRDTLVVEYWVDGIKQPVTPEVKLNFEKLWKDWLFFLGNLKTRNQL
jgi:hypothetical protein